MPAGYQPAGPARPAPRPDYRYPAPGYCPRDRAHGKPADQPERAPALPRIPPQPPKPGGWAPSRGSAKPIACDANEGSDFDAATASGTRDRRGRRHRPAPGIAHRVSPSFAASGMTAPVRDSLPQSVSVASPASGQGVSRTADDRIVYQQAPARSRSNRAVLYQADPRHPPQGGRGAQNQPSRARDGKGGRSWPKRSRSGSGATFSTVAMRIFGGCLASLRAPGRWPVLPSAGLACRKAGMSSTAAAARLAGLPSWRRWRARPGGWLASTSASRPSGGLGRSWRRCSWATWSCLLVTSTSLTRPRWAARSTWLIPGFS